MKKWRFFVVAIIAISIVGCTADDDATDRLLPPAIINGFIYGPGDADFFNVNRALNKPTVFIAPDIFKNDLFVVSADLEIDNGDVEGTGNLVTLFFNGNRDVDLQPGIYAINPQQAVGNVQVTYSTDYDSDQQINSVIPLVSGAVRVTQDAIGFIIEVNGRDADGVQFHGNYLGRLTSLN